MAYDQLGRFVPDGTPGSSPTPPVNVASTGAPVAGTPPTGGSYYTGDPGNPITADPSAGFGARYNPAGAYNPDPNAVIVNPAAYGQGGVPGAAGPPPTPTGVAPNTGTGSLGTSPLSGAFGNAPFYGAGSAYDPVTLANTYGATQGQNPYSGQNALTAQRASNLPLVYELLNGSATLNSNNSYTDWANNYLSQGNGQGLSTADFFNAAFTNDQQNPIWQTLHQQVTSSGQKLALSPADQVKAFYTMMDQGLANTVPPNILQAMESMYAQAGSEYIQAMNAGQFNGSYTDFLQQRGLGPQMMTGGQ